MLCFSLLNEEVASNSRQNSAALPYLDNKCKTACRGLHKQEWPARPLYRSVFSTIKSPLFRISFSIGNMYRQFEQQIKLTAAQTLRFFMSSEPQALEAGAIDCPKAPLGSAALIVHLPSVRRRIERRELDQIHRV